MIRLLFKSAMRAAVLAIVILLPSLIGAAPAAPQPSDSGGNWDVWLYEQLRARLPEEEAVKLFESIHTCDNEEIQSALKSLDESLRENAAADAEASPRRRTVIPKNVREDIAIIKSEAACPHTPAGPEAAADPEKRFDYLIREPHAAIEPRLEEALKNCDLTPGKGNDACVVMLLPANRELCIEVQKQQKRVCRRHAKNASVLAACLANLKNNVMPRLAKKNRECGCDRSCHSALGKRMRSMAETLRRN